MGSFAMDSLSAMYCTSSFGLVRLVNSWQRQDLKFPVCSQKKKENGTPEYAHATLVKEEKKGSFQKRIGALAHASGVLFICSHIPSGKKNAQDD